MWLEHVLRFFIVPCVLTSLNPRFCGSGQEPYTHWILHTPLHMGKWNMKVISQICIVVIPGTRSHLHRVGPAIKKANRLLHGFLLSHWRSLLDGCNSPSEPRVQCFLSPALSLYQMPHCLEWWHPSITHCQNGRARVWTFFLLTPHRVLESCIPSKQRNLDLQQA